MKFVIFLNKTHHMNEQTIQLSIFVVFYVKFVAFLPLITIKSSLILLGCLPFTKTIRLEISGINIKQSNVKLQEWVSL